MVRLQMLYQITCRSTLPIVHYMYNLLITNTHNDVPITCNCNDVQSTLPIIVHVIRPVLFVGHFRHKSDAAFQI